MRLVAWNCCRGPIPRKLAALDALAPDVVVLSEALAPDAESERLAWFPSASRLGMQVRTRGRYRVHRLPTHRGLPNCVNPVRIEGPLSFNLLAVWTWPAPSYVKALTHGLDAYLDGLATGPLVVAGDFNGNPRFDKPRGRVTWGAAVQRLEAAGLVSAYHHVHGHAWGREPVATHHFLRDPARPFHIDFCFVPRTWTEAALALQVPHDGDWPHLSDHFPLVVDVHAGPARWG